MRFMPELFDKIDVVIRNIFDKIYLYGKLFFAGHPQISEVADIDGKSADSSSPDDVRFF